MKLCSSSPLQLYVNSVTSLGWHDGRQFLLEFQHVLMIFLNVVDEFFLSALAVEKNIKELAGQCTGRVIVCGCQ
jgi:hypothetical protein